MNITKCRSCGAPIVWMKTMNGKLNPVNPGTVDQAWFDSVPEEQRIFDNKKGHISHFATCVNASQHRRKK